MRPQVNAQRIHALLQAVDIGAHAYVVDHGGRRGDIVEIHGLFPVSVGLAISRWRLSSANEPIAASTS